MVAEPRNIIVAGIRRDGSRHLSPSWHYWDGQRFYVLTTRHRAKYKIFRRDNRAQLLVDDCTDGIAGARVDWANSKGLSG